MLLTYFLNNFEIDLVSPVITGIAFVFTFHMRCISIVIIIIIIVIIIETVPSNAYHHHHHHLLYAGYLNLYP